MLHMKVVEGGKAGVKVWVHVFGCLGFGFMCLGV